MNRHTRKIKERLTGYLGERITFQAKFDGYSAGIRYINFKDVKVANGGFFVISNLTLNNTMGFYRCDLEIGDILQFDARVAEYVINPNCIKIRNKNKGITLKRPTKISKVNTEQMAATTCNNINT